MQSTLKASMRSLLLFGGVFICHQSTLAQGWTSLLSASQRAPLKFFASTDPKKQNTDYKMLAPGQTLRVPLSSGRLLRLWSTSSEPEHLHLQLLNAGATHDLLRDNRARVGDWGNKTFTFYPDGSTLSALRELQNGATLIATNRAKVPAKWFYQATVGAVLPAIETKASQSETRFQIAPNASQTLIPKNDAGIWTQIEIELPAVKDKDALDAWRTLRLQAKYQGEDGLGLDVPLLCLSGQFWRADRVQSEACDFDGKRLKWKLPITFGADDTVSIFNGGTKKIQVVTRWRETADQSTLKADLLRLHAQFGSTRTQKDKPIPILSARGEGAFVGLALDIRPVEGTTRRSFAYLEGNETITADGTRYEGTGAEDFFDSAWYFPDKPSVGEFGGLTFKNALPPQVSAVRWMLDDAVPFQRSLQFDFEHGRANNADDLEYRWAAFWYQQPGGDFKVEDGLKYGGAAVDMSAAKNRERDVLVRRYIFGTLATMLVVGLIATLLALRRKNTKFKA